MKLDQKIKINLHLSLKDCMFHGGQISNCKNIMNEKTKMGMYPAIY